MLRHIYRISSTIILLVVSTNTYAATIFDQIQDIEPDNALWSDVDWNQRAVDDFTITAAVTIRSAEFYGIYHDVEVPGGLSQPNKFTITVYNDESGFPSANPIASSTVLALVETDTGEIDFRHWPRRHYVVDLANPITLPAGTYWLSIVNDSRGEVGMWGWTSTGRVGNATIDKQIVAPQTWDRLRTEDLTMRLDDEYSIVPSPASAVFMVPVGLVLTCRRGQ